MDCKHEVSDKFLVNIYTVRSIEKNVKLSLYQDDQKNNAGLAQLKFTTKFASLQRQ